jgi:hypothetical protein
MLGNEYPFPMDTDGFEIPNRAGRVGLMRADWQLLHNLKTILSFFLLKVP